MHETKSINKSKITFFSKIVDIDLYISTIHIIMNFG